MVAAAGLAAQRIIATKAKEERVMRYDYCIIGAGIVGLSSAMQLLKRFPGASIVVIERADGPATYQTGRNSGVIHAGVYYAPGSLKARYCREGLRDTMAFCDSHGIPYDQCGKLIVATSSLQLERLGALEDRARQNGLHVERLDRAQLAEREPNISGLGALLVAETGIVDYGAVSRGFANVFAASGGEVRYQCDCIGIREEADRVVVETTKGTIEARCVVACAGVQADRIARAAGLDLDFRIVPFRGDYYRLPANRDNLIKHLIYPVPDPDLPFLGVHLTRMIGGFITVGPNAAMALSREKYGRYDVSPRDAADLAGYSGTWRMLWKNRRSALAELASALSPRRYLELCRKYCPSLSLDDLQPYPSGIRAQAVSRDGTLLHDFLIRSTARTIHICNAPSPAATAALPIGRHIVETICEHQTVRA